MPYLIALAIIGIGTLTYCLVTVAKRGDERAEAAVSQADRRRP